MEKNAQRTLATETLLRSSVLIYWLILGVQTFVPPIAQQIAEHTLSSWFVGMAIFLGFGWAFWYNTRDIACQTLSWRPVLLLAFQTLCGFIISTDLLYIVAAEIPLVLPARAASIWIIVQTLLLTAWIFWLDQSGLGNLTFLSLPQLPHLAVVILTDIGVFALHGFAFFMGYIGASEARGRRAAERLNAELRATQELLAQSSRLAERAYVARELHDTLGHHLVALKVNLELANNLAAENPAKAPINDALSLVKRLLNDVRSVVSTVRSQPNMELCQALHTLVSGVTDISVELVSCETIQVVEPAHAHALFRCVQEAITNTLKHSNANRLWIEFNQNQDTICLILRDNGKGVATCTAGHGLTGMRERLEAVGGSLDIASSLGHGFTLKARIPKTPRLAQ